MNIRVAKHADEADCLMLFEMGAKDAPDEYQDMTSDHLYDAIERGSTFVAIDNDEIVGMVSAIPTKYASFLAMLVVLPEYRRGRLAPALIEYACETLSGRLMSIIAPHALRSFETAGFEKKGFLVTRDA